MMSNGEFEVAFHGEYRELVPNERIVSTEVYEGMPEGEALNTLKFTEVDGRTTSRSSWQHTSKEHRGAHIDSGMEAGMQDAMDLLEQVALSLRRVIDTAARTTRAVAPDGPQRAVVAVGPSKLRSAQPSDVR